MGEMTNLLPILAMFAVMYFLMILPQQKRIKKEKAFLTAMKPGDKIVTKGGLHGKLAEVAETTVVVETMSGKLKMEKSAISQELSEAVNKQ